MIKLLKIHVRENWIIKVLLLRASVYDVAPTALSLLCLLDVNSPTTKNQLNNV